MNTEVIILSEGWKFNLGDCEEAWYKGYDDSGWKNVTIPHDWSVESNFSQEYSSGTGYLSGGIGWYRLKFKLPESYQGKSIRIVFDGIYKNSQVWCNSYYLGKRPSGYTTFSYDISSLVNFGQIDNEISVKVTHTDLSDSRWFTGSGIYRKVSLVIEEPIHPSEYGIFFSTLQLNKEEAQVQVSHEIINQSDKKVNVSIETSLIEPEGKGVMKLVGKAEFMPSEIKQIILEGSIYQPKLWSMESPVLYEMETSLSVDEGEKYIVNKEKVGIREVEFNPDKGFFINGQEKKIKGVCLHHDGGCLGAAMKAEIWQRRLQALKESGCNAIRCSHNPHMPELYQLCDRMGFLVMDEAFDEWENAKNKWSNGHNVYPPRHQGYFEDFPQWHEADLSAMIKRDRNHPSVVMWSIGNEIDYPNDPYCHPLFKTMVGNNDNNKPKREQLYDPNKPNAERLTVIAKELVHIVKTIDSTRPVTLASAFPELSSQLGLFKSLDIMGYNYKEHLYEAYHKKFSHKPIIGSENGHSYQAWEAVKDHSYISGQFLWTGIDYLGEAHGWPVHGSPAGLLNSAGYKKAEFYRRKSFWSNTPVLHMSTRIDDGRTESWLPTLESWDYQEGDKVIVKCFSNFPNVVLYLNGRKLGSLEGYNEDGAYCFPVTYEPGTLRVEAIDMNEDRVISFQLETTDIAEILECDIWKEEDILSGERWEQVSSNIGYIYQLEMRLLDKNRRVTVNENHMVSMLVSGDGELIGLENGDLADITDYSKNSRMTHEGKLIAYIRRIGRGEIRVKTIVEQILHKEYEMIIKNN